SARQVALRSYLRAVVTKFQNRYRRSNSARSANKFCLCGFSVPNGEIARACGLICVVRGTGENHFSAVRAQMRPKSPWAGEAVPSMTDARRDRFDDRLGRKCEELIEREPTR